MNQRFVSPPNGEGRDHSDFARLRHARERHDGFAIGRYLQPPPLLFTRDGLNIFLGDMYRGQSAFLICSGPSLLKHDLTLLDQRGVLTMAVNNSATVVRPRLWVCVDDPGNFSEAIWYDSGILKFVPLCHMEKYFTMRDEQERIIPSAHTVGDMPAVFGYRRNENFRAEQFLYEDTFNWGQHSNSKDAYGNKGSRSVMLVALRMLFYLGVRTIYLLGCDFQMEHGKQNYAFEQDRSQSSVNGNNSSYHILNVRLEHLRPYFRQEGCSIYNCTPGSGLKVFPYLPYEEAICKCRELMPHKIITTGLYDRNARPTKTTPSVLGQATDAIQASSNQVASLSNEKVSLARQIKNLTPQFSQDPQISHDFSLVVSLDDSSTKVWPYTWQTWLKYKPWLCHLPLIILCPKNLSLRYRDLPFIQQNGRTKLISFPSGDGRCDRMPIQTLIQFSARHVTTPWQIYLDPRTIASSGELGLNKEWFLPNTADKTSVVIASSWGYTKPADAIVKLDQWANTIAGLKEHPPLNLPWMKTCDRIKHATIANWCIFVNTHWIKRVSRLNLSQIPSCWMQTILWYLATRRNETVMRVPLKHYGWEYSCGASEQIITRCEQLM